MNIPDYEVAVVGGSHAGLAAAHTLGRSKRRTVVFDTRRPRNLGATRSHNFSGNEGATPTQLRAAALKDIHLYPHVHFREGPVTNICAVDQGFRLTIDDQHFFTARKIILATGVTDQLPLIEGVAPLWGKKIFHCAYCHGWEIRDEPALVMVKGAIAWEVAMTTSQWNDQLTFILNGTDIEDKSRKEQLLQRGWTTIETPVERVAEEGNCVRVFFTDGSSVAGSAVYSKPTGVQFNNELALQLGCAVSKSGSVLTDAGMQTSVRGVFAAGDLSHPGYHQVSEAISTGHKAAAFCNNQLCMEDFMQG